LVDKNIKGDGIFEDVVYTFDFYEDICIMQW